MQTRGKFAQANEERISLGIALTLLAYLTFSGIDISTKWLSLAGVPVIQLAFMRYFSHFLISSSLMLKNGLYTADFDAEQLPLVILRAVLLTVSTVLNFFALTFIPITLTSTILFTAPLLVCALSHPLLGERVGIWRWSAIAAGFCGILIAIRPFDESFHWAVVLSLGAAACFALYTLITRRLSGVVAVDTMNFYTGAVGAFALAPFAVLQWENPANARDWALMFLLGVLGWLGHSLYTRAHSFAPATALSPYAYSFIIFVALWAYPVFGSLPDRWTVTGAAFVVCAGLVIWFRERKQGVKAAAPPQ